MTSCKKPPAEVRRNPKSGRIEIGGGLSDEWLGVIEMLREDVRAQVVKDVTSVASRYGMANYTGDWIAGVFLEAAIHLAASKWTEEALGKRLVELLAECQDPFEALSTLPMTVAIDQAFDDLGRRTK